MDGIRETEKYYCEYIFLGVPRNAFWYFLKFKVKKGFSPTLYTEKISITLQLAGLVKFIKATELECDRVALDILIRHAQFSKSKRITLVPSPDFDEFVKRNKEQLEALFLIKKAEEL